MSYLHDDEYFMEHKLVKITIIFDDRKKVITVISRVISCLKADSRVGWPNNF